jgi:hypothetical protein
MMRRRDETPNRTQISATENADTGHNTRLRPTVSTEDRRQVLAAVDDADAAQRLMAAITFKEIDGLTRRRSAELYRFSSIWASEWFNRLGDSPTNRAKTSSTMCLDPVDHRSSPNQSIDDSWMTSTNRPKESVSRIHREWFPRTVLPPAGVQLREFYGMLASTQSTSRWSALRGTRRTSRRCSRRACFDRIPPPLGFVSVSINDHGIDEPFPISFVFQNTKRSEDAVSPYLCTSSHVLGEEDLAPAIQLNGRST